MVRRTKEEAERTRCLIIDTAETVFNDKGVARTTLADIAASAGLTRGAIYWHFKNKADLFEAMCERIVLPMEEFRGKASEESLKIDPIGFLRIWSLHALRSLTDDPHTRNVFDVLLHKCEFVEELGPILERQVECTKSCIGLMQEAFQLAREQGLLRADVPPETAAFGLHAYIGGVMSSWLKAPDYFPLSDKALDLIDLYLSGLLRPGGEEG